MPSLEGLYVKWSGNGITHLDALREVSRLQYFHLGSSSSLGSIDLLADLGQLRWLGLENIKQIRDMGPIGQLTGLEGWYLGGSYWTTQHVRALEPLARLRELRYLAITNLKADDQTLVPLFALTKLETFVAAKWWSEAELAAILRRNPGLAE